MCAKDISYNFSCDIIMRSSDLKREHISNPLATLLLFYSLVAIMVDVLAENDEGKSFNLIIFLA